MEDLSIYTNSVRFCTNEMQNFTTKMRLIQKKSKAYEEKEERKRQNKINS